MIPFMSRWSDKSDYCICIMLKALAGVSSSLRQVPWFIFLGRTSVRGMEFIQVDLVKFENVMHIQFKPNELSIRCKPLKYFDLN